MAPFAGLMGGLLAVCLLARTPKGPLTPGNAVLMAVEFVAYAAGFSVVCCYLVERWRHEDSGNYQVNLPMAACAVWLAPMAAARTIWPSISLLAVAMLGWNAISMNASPLREAEVRGRLEPFGAACLLEAGAAFALLHYARAGVALVFLAGLWIAWMFRALPAYPPRLARHAACAFVLTLTCLMPLVPGGAWSFPWLGGGGDDSAPPVVLAKGAGSVTYEDSEVHKGIILYPELKPYTVLAPPLPALSRSLFRPGEAQPLSVPFFGVYWLYRWPGNAPPPGSYTLRADPTKTSFHSNDFHPLRMEARQNMGRMISLSCCRRIDTVVRNADPFRDTVAMELWLTNTQAPGRPTVALPATRPLNWSGKGEETLQFPLPSNSALREFDELVLRYKLLMPRGTRSARIAVERFVFVP